MPDAHGLRKPARFQRPSPGTADHTGSQYLICPQCGLTIKPQALWLAPEHCPRCIARRRSAITMFSSPLRRGELYHRTQLSP